MGKKYGPQPVAFKPTNKDKYTGSYPIISRSSWETAAMRYFDRCSSCISWGSESTVIRFYNPVKQKICRYFVDFTVVFKTKTGDLKKFYIEVKPYRQTIPPKPSKRKKQKTIINETNTYKVNCAKWEAATEWAKKKGGEFIILTEKELYGR